MDRPIISEYKSLAFYVRDMIAFRKKSFSTEKFSVAKSCKQLRRVSPALVTLIVSGERKLTLDRCDEFAKLLDLTHQERQFLKDWVSRHEAIGLSDSDHDNEAKEASKVQSLRRNVSSKSLLEDWLNVYVKDAFQIRSIRDNPKLIYSYLGLIASQKRIDASIAFLLRHGFLRRTLEGQLIEETPLHSVDEKMPSQKVKQFHKATLKIAASAIDQFPTTKRYANALIVPLTPKRYRELQEKIERFAEDLQVFAENSNEGEALYQFILHLSPTGGVYGDK
ncbi:MAG: TIGR02147 family protein [Proteobacteria bacterium]|nr:TIGR02147 family protein [Pseudomonadota bacterium]